MADEKKTTQLTWYFTAGNHTLTAKYPDGIEQDFDLTTVTKGMPSSQEIMYQYGFKQWIASSFSQLYKSEKTHGAKYIPTDTEKRELAKTLFTELKQYGLFITESGTQIKIASPENLDPEKKTKSVTKVELTKANNMLDLIIKRTAGEELTDDENKWLDEMIELRNKSKVVA